MTVSEEQDISGTSHSLEDACCLCPSSHTSHCRLQVVPGSGRCTAHPGTPRLHAGPGRTWLPVVAELHPQPLLQQQVQK